MQGNQSGRGFDLIATEVQGYDGTNSHSKQRALLRPTQDSNTSCRRFAPTRAHCEKMAAGRTRAGDPRQCISLAANSVADLAILVRSQRLPSNSLALPSPP